MRLLIVDGSNVVMRAAFGGDVAPAQSVPTATRMIERAAMEFEATHLIVALDTPGVPTWRTELLPTYKANRTRDTAPWLTAAWADWTRMGWWVETFAGFEADDLIATMATRIKSKGRGYVMVMSNDSDVLPLTELDVEVLKPVGGGRLQVMTAADVCAKYGIHSPFDLVDLKAMTGEPGDNIPGVPGIGDVRAKQLLDVHFDLESVIAAGAAANACKHSALVAKHAEVARLAKRVIRLNDAAPIPPVQPGACKL